VQIKNLVENLRSALDLAGRGLFDRYGSSSKASPKIYFPWSMGRAVGAALLTWTTDKPTMPGLHGYRRSPGWVGFVVEIELEGATLTVDDRNDECGGEVDNIEGEWAGPLEPPESLWK
jgi:hypothetical protein